MFRIALQSLLVIAALTPDPALPADPADPAVAVPSVGYHSAIDTYRSDAVEPVGSWRDANDRVGRQPGAHAHGAGGDVPADDPHAAHRASSNPPAAHDHGGMHHEAEPTDGGTSHGNGCHHPVKQEAGHDHH